MKTKTKKTLRKKHPRNKKTNNLLIFIVIAIVFGSFLTGIGLGYVDGLAHGVVKHPARIAVAREITPTPKPMIPTANVHVPILVYHYVEYVRDVRDTIRKSLDILPPTLELQIQTLQKTGYEFITASDLGQYLDGIKQLPAKPVILTFDDGYGDFYTDVFPILKKYHVMATEYIISGVIGKLNYMTHDQIREIAESGLVEIGAHTVHHPNLKSVTLERAKKEIEQSKSDLENEFGIRVVSFAYPYGGFNSDVADFVKKAGFTNAVTTKGGLIANQENRYTLFRIHPGAAIGEGLLRAI